MGFRGLSNELVKTALFKLNVSELRLCSSHIISASCRHLRKSILIFVGLILY